jgi:cyclohexadienyl dehydratase
MTHLLRTLISLLILLTMTNANAGPVGERVAKNGVLRVCIWPDYYSITYRNPRNQELSGIDVELSAALASDLGVKLEYVDSSFSKLADDVNMNRCDIAMFGVAITVQRQQVLAFSQPYLQSGIYAVVTRNSRVVRKWDDIDKPGSVIAVQAGTFMEPVMVRTLKNARLVSIKPPQTREQELEAGRVDAFMTDYPYSRRLIETADWAKLVSPAQPFNPIPYAYAVQRDDNDWLKRIDAFVSAIKSDGRLEKAASRAGLGEIFLRK